MLVTIGMNQLLLDYDDHELHSIIHENWKHNKIPNMVLSCNIPSEQEINSVFTDFQGKFEDAEIVLSKVMIVASPFQC